MRNGSFVKVMICIAVVLGTGAHTNAQPHAIGAEFRVNTYTTSFQRTPRVRFDRLGALIVAWESGDGAEFPGIDGSESAVSAQRFDIRNVAVGGEFVVNTYTLGAQRYPAVAFSADRGFLVTWDGCCKDENYAVFLQRYDAGGARQGLPVTVGVPGGFGTNGGPKAAVNDLDTTLITWAGFDPSQGTTEVLGRLYASDGTPRGGSFQINSYTTGVEQGAQAFTAGGSDFFVIWSRDIGLSGRRIADDGSRIGNEFAFETSTAAPVRHPSVAMDGQGRFVVAWEVPSELGSLYGYRVVSQRFASNGTSLGGEIDVHPLPARGAGETAVTQVDPCVAASWNGDFVVVWRQATGSVFPDRGIPPGEPNEPAILARAFRATGDSHGAAFRVDASPGRDKLKPSVDVSPFGDVFFAWEVLSPSSSSFTEIHGRRFYDAPIPVPIELRLAGLAVMLVLCAFLRTRIWPQER